MSCITFKSYHYLVTLDFNHSLCFVCIKKSDIFIPVTLALEFLAHFEQPFHSFFYLLFSCNRKKKLSHFRRRVRKQYMSMLPAQSLRRDSAKLQRWQQRKATSYKHLVLPYLLRDDCNLMKFRTAPS